MDTVACSTELLSNAGVCFQGIQGLGATSSVPCSAGISWTSRVAFRISAYCKLQQTGCQSGIEQDGLLISIPILSSQAVLSLPSKGFLPRS